MAQVAQDTGLHLATGHQRHYNILYDNAVNLIREGVLGDLHYIRAQWHRGNLPHNDSWKMPLPPGVKTLKEDPDAEYLLKQLGKWEKKLAVAEEEKDSSQCEQCHWMIDQLKAQIEDRVVEAHKFDYQNAQWQMSDGSTYHRPALEELIRWRLWDRTGGGLMAELGSHQLDAASIFISAMHGGQKQYPLNVVAAANRPIFPADRDVEDHVYCLFEFPAPGYDPSNENTKQKKIGVAYASINGNGWGGYGETVFGTEGTLLLNRETEALLYRKSDVDKKTRIKRGKTRAPELETVDNGDPGSAALGLQALEVAGRGYTEEIEHWAWCIRNPDPENQPRCHPKVALGDAVIALTTNLAARKGKRMEFKKEWFDPDDDATPDGRKPDLSQYT
jgi:predicted dehydrogenase